MSEDRATMFSQRRDPEKVPPLLQLGELNDEARNAIWNVLNDHREKSRIEFQRNDIERREILEHPLDMPDEHVDIWQVILRDVHVHHDHRRLDEWSSEQAASMHDRVIHEPIDRVFDFIKFLMQHEFCPQELIEDLSDRFRRLRLAYIINTNPPATIVAAATAEEGEQLTRNFDELHAAPLGGCTTHLRNASKCINDGDAAGGIRESILAVESVAREINPNATTLAKALAPLEKQGVLQHKALKEALGKLYGYTSDEQGIRHALLDNAKANVTIDEAVFMLGACASFASYLWRKHIAAKSPP